MTTNELINDEVDILFNDKTDKWSLWLNGKVIKMASNEQTLEKHVQMLLDLERIS